MNSIRKNKITAKKDGHLVLELDTCELFAKIEEWFTHRFLVPLINKNRNVIFGLRDRSEGVP